MKMFILGFFDIASPTGQYKGKLYDLGKRVGLKFGMEGRRGNE